MTLTDKGLQAPVTLCSRTTAVKSTPIKSLRFLVVYNPLTGTRFGIRGILNAVPPVLALKSHLSYPDAASEGWNRCQQILCQSVACTQWCNTHVQSRMLNWLYIWASFHHCKLWMNFGQRTRSRYILICSPDTLMVSGVLLCGVVWRLLKKYAIS